MDITKYFSLNAKYNSLEKNNSLEPENKYVLFFDGCSKGNPGLAGAGAVIYEDEREIYANSAFVGEKETNNVAEYTGLIMGLEQANKLGIHHITIKGDSQLVIRQMKGEYKVKSPSILALYQRAKKLEKQFTKIEFIHIYRNENQRADMLSNEGICQNIV